jgi:hypothetical protein
MKVPTIIAFVVASLGLIMPQAYSQGFKNRQCFFYGEGQEGIASLLKERKLCQLDFYNSGIIMIVTNNGTISFYPELTTPNLVTMRHGQNGPLWVRTSNIGTASWSGNTLTIAEPNKNDLPFTRISWSD